jgi:diguanylate cyclase (GGDEF)-like protein
MSRLVDTRDYDAALSIRRSRRAPQEIQNLHRAFQDMAYRLNQFVRQLQQISITDPLTELPNRRHFEAEVRRLSNTASDGRPAGSLLLLDLDHFKRVNDQRGHPAGDRVLQGFAEVIRNTLRENDLPARIGGEEFAVLAPQTSAQDAEELGHRIRRETKRILGVTVSVGIAEVTHPETDKDDGDLSAVFAKADSALYTSKRRGRNRVTVYVPDSSS